MPTSSQRSVKQLESTPKTRSAPCSAKSSRFDKLTECQKVLHHRSDTSLSSRHTDDKKGEEQKYIKSNSFLRSQSIPNLNMKAVNGRLIDDIEKNSVNKPSKSGSENSSPIPQFCTPLRNGYRMPTNRRGLDNATKQILKSFSCEINLKVSTTPDCYSKVNMETPQNKEKSANTSVFGEVETSNIIVGVRVRPLNLREESNPCVTNVLSVYGNEVTVVCDSGASHIFMYDHCFVSHEPDHPQSAGQDQVFTTMVEPLVDKMFEGYNACLFAYGQTGSGKSYSMMGKDIDADNVLSKEAGIIPRFCYELFSRIGVHCGKDQEPVNSTTVEISYFEIYNEKIHDLLGSSDSGKKAALKVREHPVLGPYVENLSAHGVTSYEDLKGWLKVGNSQRATAATEMNEKSSRSHSIFSVILTQTKNETVLDERHSYKRRSKINLVDLAGSERIAHTGACGDRLREGVSINRSLLTLGKVISALCESAGNTKKKIFVPYRESVLTWLLRESLGGSARAAMLATVSPASVHADETLATLRYACQARSIVNSVRVCELPQDRLVRELRAEVERIRTLREDFEYQSKLPYHVADAEVSGEINRREEEIIKLKEQLRQSQEHLSEADKCWSERLREAEQCKAAELSQLQQRGVAVQLHWRGHEPCLVSLAPDPLLSGTLLYRLPAGSLSVGRPGGSPSLPPPDICLSGPLVRDRHCTINNSGGQLTLCPSTDGQTFINGQAVERRTELRHGDRLVIGGNHFFRVNNPQDPLAQAQELAAQQPADYQFAWEEIQQVQQARLQEQLEEAKRTALRELEQARDEAQSQLGNLRSRYEQQLQQLGCSLEEQKDAFNEISKKKEQLEIEKKLLEEEIMSHKSQRSLLPLDESFVITPYQSNFLQEVQEILNEAETTIRENYAPEEFDHVTLHDIRVMIQEATERCKQLDITYVFRHCHIPKNGVFQPVVQVKDCRNYTVSFWNLTDFKYWLERLRHHDPDDDAVPLLNNNNVGWETCDSDDGDFEDDSITVSTKHIKRQLNESILQLSFDSSAGEATENREYEDIKDCLHNMERNTQDLSELCSSQNDGVKKIVSSINKNIQQLKAALRLGHSSPTEPAQASAADTATSPQPGLRVVPGKSNLRSSGSGASNTPKVQKNVRFLLTDSQSKILPE